MKQIWSKFEKIYRGSEQDDERYRSHDHPFYSGEFIEKQIADKKANAT